MFIIGGSPPVRQPKRQCSTISRCSVTGSVCIPASVTERPPRHGRLWKGASGPLHDALISSLHSQGEAQELPENALGRVTPSPHDKLFQDRQAGSQQAL